MKTPPPPTPAATHGPLAPWLFLLPALLVYALFVIVPVAESFRLSLYDWPYAGADPIWAGLANFRELMDDPVFWSALWHNVALIVLSLLIQLPVAMALAILLTYPIRGRKLFRAVFFAPMVMPSVAIAILWTSVYLPQQGLLDQALRLFGRQTATAWLSDPATALPCVFATICWRFTGFHMVLFMAGLAAIPGDLYEAARMDGAGEWSVCRHITLPLLRPTIAVSATLSVIGSLKYFDLVYMMAGGAPRASREIMATFVYRQAFEGGQGRYGYSAAASVALFAFAFAVAGGVHWLQARSAGREAAA